MPIGEAIESVYLKWKSEQHRMTPKYDILRSFVPLVENNHVTEDNDDKPFKITCKSCNKIVRCAVKSVELIYINFLHAVMSTLGLCPE